MADSSKENMPDANNIKEDIIKLEYASLRDELAKNKQYVFERPLIIIAAIGAALVQFKSTDYLPILPFLLIVTIWTNLALTVNRLRSSSRIISYIQVMLEPPNLEKWRGWENSLRDYRIWKSTQSLPSNANESLVDDALRFSPTIFKFHIAIVAIAFIVSIFIFFDAQENTNLLWRRMWLLLSLAATAAFGRYCYFEYNNKNLKGNIEIEKRIWEAIFNVSPLNSSEKSPE